ncbi:hypothetical protein [Tumidithrix helvetica]
MGHLIPTSIKIFDSLAWRDRQRIVSVRSLQLSDEVSLAHLNRS